jgi:hypothetical protein
MKSLNALPRNSRGAHPSSSPSPDCA